MKTFNIFKRNLNNSQGFQYSQNNYQISRFSLRSVVLCPHLCTHTYTYIHIHTHIHTYVYIYIYIHIYIHICVTYIYIYIYIRIPLWEQKSKGFLWEQNSKGFLSDTSDSLRWCCLFYVRLYVLSCLHASLFASFLFICQSLVVFRRHLLFRVVICTFHILVLLDISQVQRAGGPPSHYIISITIINIINIIILIII